METSRFAIADRSVHCGHCREPVICKPGGPWVHSATGNRECAVTHYQNLADEAEQLHQMHLEAEQAWQAEVCEWVTERLVVDWTDEAEEQAFRAILGRHPS